jgi:hypothetical protein
MMAGTGRGRLGVGWIVSGVSVGAYEDARGDDVSCAWGLREVVFGESEDGGGREMEGRIREGAGLPFHTSCTPSWEFEGVRIGRSSVLFGLQSVVDKVTGDLCEL